MKFSNHRNEVERQIIVCLVEDLLAAGYMITVNDGEDDVLACSTTDIDIFAAMSTTDEDRLYVHNRTDAPPFGWIRLIYGNGADVICDYTTNIPETVLEESEALAERFGQ